MPVLCAETLNTLQRDKKPILIAGPTASGKSGLALELATELDGVIINADALQVYDVWRVLSARPYARDEAAAPHRLYGHIRADQDYSVGHWLRDVERALHETTLRPIIIGGTGLYFTSLTDGLADIPATPPDVRLAATKLGEDQGLSVFADLLREHDPKIVPRIDMNNPVRAQRAWEVFQATGRSLADWQDETGPAILPLDQAHAFVLSPDVDVLKQRIDKRFDQMMTLGALEECEEFIRRGIPLTHPSAQAIGAKELIAYLEKTMSYKEAIDTSKLKTRRYAKRQRTWFRNRLKKWQVISTS